MSKVALLMFLVFLTLALYLNSVLTVNSDDYDIESNGINAKKLLWYGPRIGRRKRNPSENIFRAMDKDEMDRYAGVLKDPWAIMILNNGKRQMNFTPRLGRTFADEDDDLDIEDFIKHKPLTPRVGRRLPTQYSPRMGRENDELTQL